MLRLILLRHSKSSWNNPLQADFDRELNKRGRKNAKDLGLFLKNRQQKIDLIICSPARRTRETLEQIQLNFKANHIIFNEKIYEASLNTILSIVMETKEINSLMIIGHNPSITDLADYLSDERIAHVPTSGLIELEFETNNWVDILLSEKKVVLKLFIEK